MVRPLLDIRDAQGFARAFGVSRETIARLEAYAGLLRHWQTITNLVSPATLSVLWQRHMADSAQLVDLASSSSRVWVDLGSGAGFPGLVLAILLGELRPDARVHLVESNGKKVAFLREVARQTGTSVEIHGARIELLVDTRRIESVDVVTARALAPLGKLLGYAYPLYDANTIGLFLKGRDVEQEIEAAKADWHFDVALEPSRTDAHGRIAVVRSLKPTREG